MNSPPITLAMLASAVGMVSQLMILTEPASAVSQPRPTPASQESTANTATKIASEVTEAIRKARARRPGRCRIQTQTMNGSARTAVALTATATAISVTPSM